MLHTWVASDEDDYGDDDEETSQQFRSLTSEERSVLSCLMKALEVHREKDSKYAVILHLLVDSRWFEPGSIIFSQYFDSLWWLAHQLTTDEAISHIFGQLPDILQDVWIQTDLGQKEKVYPERLDK